MTATFHWKRLLIWTLCLVLFAGCEKPPTQPLDLPAAAEPSSKMFNDRGTEYFNKGNYDEAVISYLQARTADPHAGEIHFNIALCRHMMGQKQKVVESLKQAEKYARGNPAILQSLFFKQYMQNEG
jgi:tetratricopeptide (TPR) repeat protein